MSFPDLSVSYCYVTIQKLSGLKLQFIISHNSVGWLNDSSDLAWAQSWRSFQLVVNLEAVSSAPCSLSYPASLCLVTSWDLGSGTCTVPLCASKWKGQSRFKEWGNKIYHLRDGAVGNLWPCFSIYYSLSDKYLFSKQLFTSTV